MLRIGSAIMVIAFGPAVSISSAQPLQFSDQTTAAGVACVFQAPPGTELLPMRFGAAAGDFDRDGHQDLFVLLGGVEPDRLYINNGDGTFTDRARSWGVDRAHLGVGIAVGDVDADGWPDVFITSWGPADAPPSAGRHLLYRNIGGASFEEMADAAGLAVTSPVIPDGFGAAFGDYDLDGDLDLAVAGWIEGSGGNRLFRNNGDGTFTDVTNSAVGIDMGPVRGFSPWFADMDGDRFPELLWVADFGTSKYLRNNGDGTFTDRTVESGTGLDSNGMGSTIGDFDGDGRPDWYVSSIDQDLSPEFSGNMLYMNEGGHSFSETSTVLGVNEGGWGWGVVAADFDHDGFEDLAETNGWSYPVYTGETMHLFLNDGAAFGDQAVACGLTQAGDGRGLLNLDYDDDGDQDLVELTRDHGLLLLRNDLLPGAGAAGASWLRVFLDTSRDSRLAPDGTGSHLVVHAGGRTHHRWMTRGSNYLSQSELAAHFGLGVATVVDQLVVEWPNGKTTHLRGIQAGRTITVEAPSPADIDGDGTIGALDLVLLLIAWGQCPEPCAPYCLSDLDADCRVGIVDLLELLGRWSMPESSR